MAPYRALDAVVKMGIADQRREVESQDPNHAENVRHRRVKLSQERRECLRPHLTGGGDDTPVFAARERSGVKRSVLAGQEAGEMFAHPLAESALRLADVP